MNARHDTSYKHLFSSPKVVQHLIEGFLPAAKRLGRLDFSTLGKVPASYVSDDLRDLRPKLNVPEAHDLGEMTMQLTEGFKLWEQEVKTEARLEGRLEGEALLLQRMLTRRFGPLPEWVQTRLRSALSEELETWADRVLDATRLEEVFGE